METRLVKLSAGHSGGTASAKSRNYKISLPTTWVEQLGVNEKKRDLEISFDGDRIIITPHLSLEELISRAVNQGHKLYKFSFFDRDKLCTRIYADFTEKRLRAENFTDNFVKTAFGNNEFPSWEDFLEFLEERCIPKSRSGLREYLEVIGADSSDPLDILPITQGKMAEDDQRLIMEVLK